MLGARFLERRAGLLYNSRDGNFKTSRTARSFDTRRTGSMKGPAPHLHTFDHAPTKQACAGGRNDLPNGTEYGTIGLGTRCAGVDASWRVLAPTRPVSRLPSCVDWRMGFTFMPLVSGTKRSMLLVSSLAVPYDKFTLSGVFPAATNALRTAGCVPKMSKLPVPSLALVK